MISADKADLIRSLADPDGYIEPSAVITEARSPRSLLHEDFNWNVQEAAEAHWLETARRLIRFVKLHITIQHREISCVHYVVDPERPPKSKRFIDLTIAAQHRNMAQQILLDEMERITAAVRRAQQVAMVLGLSAQLDALLQDIHAVIAAAEIKRTKTKAKKRAKAKHRTTAREEARA